MVVLNKTTLAGSLFVLLVTTGASAPILAEEQAYIEEIVVTAQKRQESMQDVAVSVTALSGDLLEQTRITQSQDLVKLTPSLTLQDGGESRSSSFNIRGIGTQSYSSGVEPSVSTVADGVVMGRAGMAFAQMMDLKRVEILRGPQGMLFGKNASAGVVHLISNDPTDDFEANVGATMDEDAYRVTGVLSAPINDQIAFRLAAMYGDRDGLTENEFNGKNLNGAEEQAYRFKLRWNPTDDLEFKLSTDYAKLDAVCCQPQPRVSTNVDVPFFGNQEALMDPIVGSKENRDVNVGANIYNDSEASGTSLEVNWDLNGYTLTSISAVRNWEIASNVDVDGTPSAFLDLNEGSTDQKQFTQELRLASPAEDTLSYVVGAYYFDQDLDRKFARHLYLVLPIPSVGYPGVGFLGQFDSTTETTNYAAFGQLTANITDEFRLIAGARYTHDELDFQFERTGLIIQGGVPIYPQPQFKNDTSDSDTSFKLGAQWDVNDDIMAYVTASEGYKSAAYNVIFEMSPDTAPIDAETSDSFEFGIKSRLLDNQLILNAAAFHTVYHDFQSQAQDATSGTFQLLSVGDITTQGFEVDFIARPSANFDVFGGLAFVDTEIDDLDMAPCSPLQTANMVSNCAVNGTQDVRGEGMPHSPKFKATLAASYLLQFADFPVDITLNGGYRYQSDVLYSIDQDKNKEQSAYGILDLSVTAMDKAGHYQISLFVDNALDKNYASAIFHNNIYSNAAAGSFPYDQYISKDAERLVGIEAKYYWF